MIPGLVIAPKFMGYCVYVWKRNNPDDADTVMYVGSSSRGIRRLAIGHHALPIIFTEDDYVEVYSCSSKQTMIALEYKLIDTLKPRENLMRPKLDKVVRIVKPMPRYIRKGPGVKLKV